MAIVAGFDVHRAQLTFDALNQQTGEVERGRIRATPEAVRAWVGRFAGDEVHVAVEACTGWLFVCEALAETGAVAHLAEPVDVLLDGRLVSRLGQVVEHEPLVSNGWSGNVIERLVLADSRRLIAKRIVPGSADLGACGPGLRACQPRMRSPGVRATTPGWGVTPTCSSPTSTVSAVVSASCVGLRPQMPQKWAGTRVVPPRSPVIASGTAPEATRAASPPLEPPGVCSADHGLTVLPYSGLSARDRPTTARRCPLPPERPRPLSAGRSAARRPGRGGHGGVSARAWMGFPLQGTDP